jgi:hypothetical protein
LNTISELAKKGRIDTSELITMKTLKVKIIKFKCHGSLDLFLLILSKSENGHSERETGKLYLCRMQVL